jgi:hypothetical protein
VIFPAPLSAVNFGTVMRCERRGLSGVDGFLAMNSG